MLTATVSGIDYYRRFARIDARFLTRFEQFVDQSRRRDEANLSVQRLPENRDGLAGADAVIAAAVDQHQESRVSRLAPLVRHDDAPGMVVIGRTLHRGRPRIAAGAR